VTKISENLPKYENPPVIEVVCGILFRPIERMLAPHLGLLWEKYKRDHPSCQEVPPLAPVIERFEETPAQTVELELSNRPLLPRIWFVTSNGTGIIQIQTDRFLYNWRRVRGEDEYPHYHQVVEMFRDHLAKFELFLGEAEIGTIEPLQYEITYVNHIPRGSGWTNLNDIDKVFPDLAWRGDQERFLPAPEGINWRTAFVLANRTGRLHASVRHVVRPQDRRRIVLLELTARGMGDDMCGEGMWTWFDLAHEWIVRGFADLTGEEVQRNIWGLRQ
jgi:uncharacterized protein (TIGR04255 family)